MQELGQHGELCEPAPLGTWHDSVVGAETSPEVSALSSSSRGRAESRVGGRGETHGPGEALSGAQRTGPAFAFVSREGDSDRCRSRGSERVRAARRAQPTPLSPTLQRAPRRAQRIFLLREVHPRCSPPRPERGQIGETWCAQKCAGRAPPAPHPSSLQPLACLSPPTSPTFPNLTLAILSQSGCSGRFQRDPPAFPFVKAGAVLLRPAHSRGLSARRCSDSVSTFPVSEASRCLST